MAKLTVKICLLGGQGTGKSSIALRFIEGFFDTEITSTIGAAYMQKDLESKSGNIFHLQLWDTAGQERYSAIAPMYYRGAAVIIVVYDVTSSLSFTHDLRNWINQLKKNCDLNDLILVLVGNKVDVDVNRREVDKAEAQKYADNLGANYWETSAKTGFNIEEVFADICSTIDGDEHIKKMLLSKSPKSNERLTLSPHLEDTTEVAQSRSSCCT